MCIGSCLVQTAARYAARHSTHSTETQLYESGQVSLKDRCSLVYVGLHKAAWGQVVLRYICVLVCCCKLLDSCINTACQGICINIESFFKSFASIYFVIYLILYFSSHTSVRILKEHLSVRKKLSAMWTWLLYGISNIWIYRIPAPSFALQSQITWKLHKKAASTVTNVKKAFKCSHNQGVFFFLLQPMLIFLVLSSLQVTKAARTAKRKTEHEVWSEVSWERVKQCHC